MGNRFKSSTPRGNVVVSMKIRDAMRKNLVTIKGSAKVAEASRLMGKERVGSVIIIEDGKPKGIFTERDLLTKVIASGVKVEEAIVSDFMSSPLTVISPDFDIKDAVQAMAQLKIRRLPVSEKGRLVGIITSSDILRVIAEKHFEV